jgi:hypothetical protein
VLSPGSAQGSAPASLRKPWAPGCVHNASSVIQHCHGRARCRDPAEPPAPR